MISPLLQAIAADQQKTRRLSSHRKVLIQVAWLPFKRKWERARLLNQPMSMSVGHPAIQAQHWGL